MITVSSAQLKKIDEWEQSHFESESKMEDFVLKLTSKNGSNPFDYSTVSKSYRQVRTESHGVIDIVLVDYDDSTFIRTITIIELKNKPLTLQDVDQILRYKAFFDGIFTKNPLSTKFKYQLVSTDIGKVNNTPFLYDLIVKSGIDVIEFNEFPDPMTGYRTLPYSETTSHVRQPISNELTDEILHDYSWF